MELAPIALFVYNRKVHVQQVVEALVKNPLASQSELFIFSDAAKNPAGEESIAEVRNYLRLIDGFKSIRIVERESNYGLAASIIDGVTFLCEQYGRAIVVEDDLATSPFFLKYMNDGLNAYADVENVISIHGYVYPVDEALPETFFLRGADCWGWATWQRGWALFEPNGEKLLNSLVEQNLDKTFNFDDSNDYMGMLRDQVDGKINSWAIRWYASAFLANKLTLYPGVSLVQNIGNDGSGTHSHDTDRFHGVLRTTPVMVGDIAVEQSPVGYAAFRAYFLAGKRSFANRFKSRLVRMAKAWIR